MGERPYTGATSTCKTCGGNILYTGLAWRHYIAGEIVIERHPAEPATPRRVDTAILQQPVQCQVEADGDMIWA